MLQLESAPKFPPGRVVITDHAANEISPEDIALALRRHVQGDWGDLEAPNRRENERALLLGCRLLSAYSSRTGCASGSSLSRIGPRPQCFFPKITKAIGDRTPT